MPATRHVRLGTSVPDARRYGRFPLRTPSAFRVLVDLVSQHYGSDSEAAHQLGLERRTLAALRRRGRGQAVAQKTLGAMAAAFDAIDPTGRRGLHPQLAECFVTPAVRQFYDESYGEWCQQRLTRFEREAGRLWRCDGRTKPWLVPDREGRFWRQQVQDDLIRKAERSGDTKAVVADYRGRMTRMGIPEERQDVALLRVVEPLAEWMAMGTMQRRWRDLSSGERKAFLRQGFLRELILLKGEHPQRWAARLVG